MCLVNHFFTLQDERLGTDRHIFIVGWQRPLLAASLYVLAYVVGLSMFIGIAHQRGLLTEGMYIITGMGILGGLAGAVLRQWFFAGSFGKTILGGFAGCYLTVVLVKRFIGLRRPTGDLFGPALCAGEAVGRFGCFYAGCCYGKPAMVSWAVWQHGVWRHPAQLYISIADMLILLAVWRLAARSPEHRLPENGLFFVLGMLYTSARFIIEFFRESTRWMAGLSIAQVACLAGFAFFFLQFRVWSGVSARPDQCRIDALVYSNPRRQRDENCRRTGKGADHLRGPQVV